MKGHRQYWLKFDRPAEELAAADLQWVTVCQANPAMFPRLKDGGSQVTYAASGQALVSAGPNLAQTQPHVIEGSLDSPYVMLELSPPRQSVATQLYAAAHVASSNPPDPDVRYQIDYSVDGGSTWEPVVHDWRIVRQGVEPEDFWSQSFCYGERPLLDGTTNPVRVRFRNDGGKRYLRAEVHLAYEVPSSDGCRVTFAWSDSNSANRNAEHTFTSADGGPWSIDTADNVQMHWLEFASAP